MELLRFYLMGHAELEEVITPLGEISFRPQIRTFRDTEIGEPIAAKL